MLTGFGRRAAVSAVGLALASLALPATAQTLDSRTLARLQGQLGNSGAGAAANAGVDRSREAGDARAAAPPPASVPGGSR